MSDGGGGGCGGGGCGAFKYSCKTATETLEWIHAIIDFLKPYQFFLDAHVVNFFKDRMWDTVDKEWMDCLRKEPVEKLMQIPSGVVQGDWPASLKEYVLNLRSLAFPRDQTDLQEAFPGLVEAPLNNVIAQGMNQKKKHEIEALAAVIGSIARRVGAHSVVDVGSGQGYLAQVLSFEYDLPVIAIDASSHLGGITDARARRIEKYYAAKMRKSRSEKKSFSMPRTVTCRVLSSTMLKDVSSTLVQGDISRENVDEEPLKGTIGSEYFPPTNTNDSLLVLAGLHACGDLSVTMLRTFVECDGVKAMVSIGCCYNLLSEGGIKESDNDCGFPVSTGAKSASVELGKNARDLACQSAERWKGLGEAAGQHNFELHVYRAAFQLVLFRYYPEVITKSLSIGRQGKALRRQHHRRILESNADTDVPFSHKQCSTWAKCSMHNGPSSYPESSYEESCTWSKSSDDRYSMFVKFCKSGLDRIGLHDSQDIDFLNLWKEAEEFSELVGPYWTLRAALGPVLETLLLLDRLLFLQEQRNVFQASLLPLFDPLLSPRNLALIAEKF